MQLLQYSMYLSFMEFHWTLLLVVLTCGLLHWYKVLINEYCQVWMCSFGTCTGLLHACHQWVMDAQFVQLCGRAFILEILHVPMSIVCSSSDWCRLVWMSYAEISLYQQLCSPVTVCKHFSSHCFTNMHRHVCCILSNVCVAGTCHIAKSVCTCMCHTCCLNLLFSVLVQLVWSFHWVKPIQTEVDTWLLP